MCGIVGIVGKREVAPLLVDALKRLEYRGYDSAGVATIHDGKLDRRRAEGKLGNLDRKIGEEPLAGQVGNAPDGSVPDSAEAQYENALKNIVALLASEGCSPADIVKLNSYLVQRMDLPTVAATRRAVLGDVRPAATMVYVAGLAAPEYLVEVEAWAVRPG